MTSRNDDKPVVGPNPELYARLSAAYNDRASADAQLDLFLRRVQQAREESGISDVLVVCAVHFKPSESEKETISCKALALGSPDTTAQLGALGFQAYTLPEIKAGDKLRAIAKGDTDRVNWGDRTTDDEV
jgi:hypothetical protein